MDETYELLNPSEKSTENNDQPIIKYDGKLVKRGRGRPRKIVKLVEDVDMKVESTGEITRKKRGHPKKAEDEKIVKIADTILTPIESNNLVPLKKRLRNSVSLEPSQGEGIQESSREKLGAPTSGSLGIKIVDAFTLSDSLNFSFVNSEDAASCESVSHILEERELGEIEPLNPPFPHILENYPYCPGDNEYSLEKTPEYSDISSKSTDLSLICDGINTNWLIPSVPSNKTKDTSTAVSQVVTVQYPPSKRDLDNIIPVQTKLAIELTKNVVDSEVPPALLIENNAKAMPGITCSNSEPSCKQSTIEDIYIPALERNPLSKVLGKEFIHNISLQEELPAHSLIEGKDHISKKSKLLFKRIGGMCYERTSKSSITNLSFSKTNELDMFETTKHVDPDEVIDERDLKPAQKSFLDEQIKMKAKELYDTTRPYFNSLKFPILRVPGGAKVTTFDDLINLKFLEMAAEVIPQVKFEDVEMKAERTGEITKKKRGRSKKPENKNENRCDIKATTSNENLIGNKTDNIMVDSMQDQILENEPLEGPCKMSPRNKLSFPCDFLVPRKLSKIKLPLVSTNTSNQDYLPFVKPCSVLIRRDIPSDFKPTDILKVADVNSNICVLEETLVSCTEVCAHNKEGISPDKISPSKANATSNAQVHGHDQVSEYNTGENVSLPQANDENSTLDQLNLSETGLIKGLKRENENIYACKSHCQSGLKTKMVPVPKEEPLAKSSRLLLKKRHQVPPITIPKKGIQIGSVSSIVQDKAASMSSFSGSDSQQQYDNIDPYCVEDSNMFTFDEPLQKSLLNSLNCKQSKSLGVQMAFHQGKTISKINEVSNGINSDESDFSMPHRAEGVFSRKGSSKKLCCKLPLIQDQKSVLSVKGGSEKQIFRPLHQVHRRVFSKKGDINEYDVEPQLCQVRNRFLVKKPPTKYVQKRGFSGSSKVCTFGIPSNIIKKYVNMKKPSRRFYLPTQLFSQIEKKVVSREKGSMDSKSTVQVKVFRILNRAKDSTPNEHSCQIKLEAPLATTDKNGEHFTLVDDQRIPNLPITKNTKADYLVPNENDKLVQVDSPMSISNKNEQSIQNENYQQVKLKTCIVDKRIREGEASGHHYSECYTNDSEDRGNIHGESFKVKMPQGEINTLPTVPGEQAAELAKNRQLLKIFQDKLEVPLKAEKAKQDMMWSQMKQNHSSSHKSRELAVEPPLAEVLDGVPPFIAELFKCENLVDGFISSDLVFLLKLLPDLEEMTVAQKNAFKLQMIDLIEDIFKDQSLH